MCAMWVGVVSEVPVDCEDPATKVEDSSDVCMEEAKMSRKGLLKMMKIREVRRKKKKTKRLGGKKSHSKW